MRSARWLPAVSGAVAVAAFAFIAANSPSPRQTDRLTVEPARDSVALWIFFDPAATLPEVPPAISPGVPETELPIPARLTARVEAAGARVRYASRWLRAVSVNTDAAGAARIARLPEVIAIRPLALLVPATARFDSTRRTAYTASVARAFRRVCGQGADSVYYGANWRAMLELGVPAAHVFGYTGKGVRIAILDTGFEPRHESLVGRQVLRSRDFINGDSIVYDEPGDPASVSQQRHGTQVWSLIGGCKPGSVVGPAYDAAFVLAKVDQDPGDTRGDEDRWVAGVEWADSMGARIINSSVAFRFDFTDRPAIAYGELNGDSTITTRIADEAARRGILVVQAVGNGGPAIGSLSAPADADSVIAVGAVDALGQAATFNGASSARGPTADGRTKPELSARGVGLTGASSVTRTSYDAALAGTSYSTALISGAAAMFMEAWPTLSAVAVRDALLLSASNARTPNNSIGAGVPNVAAAILFPQGLTPRTVATINLQGELTTIAPTFSWDAPLVQALMRPVIYRLELATDPVFDHIVYSDTVREAFSLRVRRAVKPAIAVWWRVIGTTTNDAVRSTSSVAGPFIVPGWVRLISPNGNQVTFVDTERPELSWAPLEAPPPIGPLVYDVEIVANESGTLAQPTIRNLTSATVRVPVPLVPNRSYRWRVIARTQLGSVDTVESTAPFVVTSTQQPPATLLHQNFPNPFPRPGLGRTTTTIWFDLAQRTAVELAVYDLRGRLVRSLIPASASCGAVTLDPGIYGRDGELGSRDACVLTEWDGRDADGREAFRGVYVLRLRTADKEEIRHMLYLPDGR